MSRFSSLACLGVLSFVFAASAHADCGFNAPARAVGMRTWLVRTYAPCGGYTFPFPFLASSSGVPACGPPAPISDADPPGCSAPDCTYASSAYSFSGDDSKCRVKITQSTTELCGDSPNPPAQCLSLQARLVCVGIRDADDKPAHSKSFALRVPVRFTTNDGAPATVIDVPLVAEYHVAGGKISETQELWASDTGLPLSTCTQVQVLGMDLLDDAGLRFATMGSSAR